MDDRTKTVAATGIIIGFFLLIILIVAIALTGKKVLSPIPEEGAIKIIFLTPSPTSGASPSSFIGTSPTPKNTVR